MHNSIFLLLLFFAGQALRTGLGNSLLVQFFQQYSKSIQFLDEEKSQENQLD